MSTEEISIEIDLGGPPAPQNRWITIAGTPAVLVETAPPLWIKGPYVCLDPRCHDGNMSAFVFLVDNRRLDVHPMYVLYGWLDKASKEKAKANGIESFLKLLKFSNLPDRTGAGGEEVPQIPVEQGGQS